MEASRVKTYFSTFFNYINEKSFDKEFRMLLKIFYFFGYYRPVPSTKRLIYGLLVLINVQVGYVLGSVEDFFVAFNEGDLKRTLINTVIMSMIGSFAIQNLTFIARQTRVVKLIQNLQSLHDDEDDGLFEPYRNKCCRLVKIYTVYVICASSAVIFLSLFDYNVFKLVVPAIYDKYAQGYLYYPLFFINTAQIYCCAMMMMPSDLLHIFCIVRAGVNFEALSMKLRQSADSESTVENEKNLVACVKYHWAIIREIQDLREIFHEYFMSKAYGTISVLTCLLFVLLKSNISEELQLLMMGSVSILVTLFQFGALCFFGQWLTSKSADLLDASYDCKWFEQSKSFKKTLMILRFSCQREMKLGVVKIEFSHESFYQMMSNVYYYLNSMSKSIEAIERKTF